MKVILLSEQELKSLGEAVNRDYLEYCLKTGAQFDLMDHPPGRNPAEGLYKKIHFTLHRWLNEVGSSTRVEHMDTDIAKQRTRDLRWSDMGLLTERWLDSNIDETLYSDAECEDACSLESDREAEIHKAGFYAAREQLRKKLEKYLADPAKY